MNEEQRNREKAFMEFEIREIEKAKLIPGEDEELIRQYKKLANGRRSWKRCSLYIRPPDTMARAPGNCLERGFGSLEG